MKQTAVPEILLEGDSITIETSCRLHLGLMEICHHEPNLYGGIGLMAQHPVTRIEAIVGRVNDVSHIDVVANEYWQSRVTKLCQRWQAVHHETSLPVSKIVFHQCAPQHCGLGSGTQVACTIMTLLEQASGRKITNTEQLKTLTGRGARSCVGLQGFMEGGFIVDYGRSASAERASQRLDFPADWRLLQVRVSSSVGDSGDAEQEMFNRCATKPNPHREHMLELIEHEIVPAIETHDWDRWDTAVGQYGYYAGQIFSSCQGGVYRTARIGQLVDELAQFGCLGAAQSSWGPTVLVVAKDADHALWLEDTIKKSFNDSEIQSSPPQNHAARLLRT